MNPSKQVVADALRRLTLSELPDDHPRKLARDAIMEFRSNAQREGLPIANVHDDKGAPVLMRDEVVRSSIPNHAEPAVKTRQGWWRRLFGR